MASAVSMSLYTQVQYCYKKKKQKLSETTDFRSPNFPEIDAKIPMIRVITMCIARKFRDAFKSPTEIPPSGPTQKPFVVCFLFLIKL